MLLIYIGLVHEFVRFLSQTTFSQQERHFICDIPFYSFRIPLSKFLGYSEIFRTKTMECQVEKNEHFRHLPYDLNRGSKAAEAAQNICAVCGEGSIAKRTAQKWFARFK
jgi:hypothetical protein